MGDDAPAAQQGRAHDVMAVGSAIVDVLAETDDDFVARLGLVKGTMALIDIAAAERLYEAMGPAVEMSGGSAANTVAGVASLGGSAAFVGRVRDDQLGAVFSHDLRAAGVHFATPPATSGPPTARSLILVTPDGERTMNTYLGAAACLEPEDVDPSVLTASRIAYLEGYLWDPPQAKEALRRTVAVARSAGVEVALTLSDPFCVERHRDEFLELIEGGVGVVFANDVELTSLFEVDGLDEALELVAARCSVAAVTRGALGSVAAAGREVTAVAAHPVERVVDTTGAGDLYAAGFLFGLARGLGLERCARLGGLAAAEVISHFGARPWVSLSRLAAEAGLLGPEGGRAAATGG
ncbi:MAG TPA: adenosine kinase [Acidimicrobiales bacterium]|nr:adenosine kinase [Acidimicrobiales bacterium]